MKRTYTRTGWVDADENVAETMEAVGMNAREAAVHLNAVESRETFECYGYNARPGKRRRITITVEVTNV